VLDVAHAWYTNQVVNGHLTLPPAENVPSEGSETAQLDTDSPAFRGKKGITVFGHMRALFRHEEMQRLIVRSPAMFTRTVNFLNMFVGLQTQRKEDGGHIEFEVDWPRSFAILGELAKCCREFGEAYQYADLEKLLADIAIVATRIMSDMMLMSSTLDRTRYAQPVMADVENVLVRGSRHTLIKENVSQIEAFSFHHYMNLLLAEMLKAVRKVIGFSNGQHRGADLRSIFESTVLKAQGAPDVELMKLLLVEYPMQSEFMDKC
jgi:E3 ubiquitin-protein ligase UBR1